MSDGMTTAAAGVFAVVSAAMYAAQAVGDHWVQTEAQAAAKGLPGWAGRWACARHVATLSLVKIGAIALAVAVTGVQPDGNAVAAALVTDAVSHYWADRRVTLRGLARRLGHGQFWMLGAPREGHDDNATLGTGAYALDQSWHAGWLFISALIASVGAR
jgi:hypothetical protein